MQRLEVSGAVRPIYGSLGVKRLIFPASTTPEPHWLLFLAKSLDNPSGAISVGGEVCGNVRTKWETPNCGLRSSGRFKVEIKALNSTLIFIRS